MYQQYYPNYYYPQQQQQIPQRQEQSGFIRVPGEQQAREWPIAPGNSLTFKDESAPYIYIKTMGMNSFEMPVFEKYRLIKEEDPSVQQHPDDTIVNLENELNEVRNSYQLLRNEVEEMKNWMRQPFISKSTEELNHEQ